MIAFLFGYGLKEAKTSLMIYISTGVIILFCNIMILLQLYSAGDNLVNSVNKHS